VNFIKSCPCFGFVELTQNVGKGSCKNLRLQQIIEAAVRDPQSLLRDPPVENTDLDRRETNLLQLFAHPETSECFLRYYF